MKIYDSVHGFIHLNKHERALIDTELFQRLRYIHQLGITFLVYPGGTHTRFEHSLGTMHLATQIFDQIAPKTDQDTDRDYWRQIVRLAALCHDLGHLPFSHVAERRLCPGGHEEWTLKIIESKALQPLWEAVRGEFPEFPVTQHIAMLAIGEEKWMELRPDTAFTAWERIYSQIIAGDFFGADRIDYLLRDAKATGLSYGLFDYLQLIETLVIIPGQDGELHFGALENGLESCEALLVARHFMQRRVYQYAAARAYSFHLARFMETIYSKPHYFASVEGYMSMSEPEVLCSLQKAKRDPSHPGHLDAIALFDRKKRFNAHPLPFTATDEQLQEYKNNLNIPGSLIHWDLEATVGVKYGLKMPILRKNGVVAPAEELSEILIPPTQKNWLYLSPDYDIQKLFVLL